MEKARWYGGYRIDGAEVASRIEKLKKEGEACGI